MLIEEVRQRGTQRAIAAPPQAQRRPVQIAKHDDVRVDDFFWLRERDNPEVLQYLAAENDYTAAAMAHTQALQETLYQEMVGRIRETDDRPPCPKATTGTTSAPKRARTTPSCAGANAETTRAEEILLDVNELALGHAFCDLGEWRVSPDQNLLAYAWTWTATRRLWCMSSAWTPAKCCPSAWATPITAWQWDAASQHVFYTTLGDAHRPDSVWRHRVGDDPCRRRAHLLRAGHAFLCRASRRPQMAHRCL